MTATSQNYMYEFMNKLNPENPVSVGYDAAAMDNRKSENPSTGKNESKWWVLPHSPESFVFLCCILMPNH